MLRCGWDISLLVLRREVTNRLKGAETVCLGAVGTSASQF